MSVEKIGNSNRNFTLLPFLEFFLGYSEAPAASTEQRLKPMCLPSVTQVGHKHATQYIRLVHTDTLCHRGRQSNVTRCKTVSLSMQCVDGLIVVSRLLYYVSVSVYAYSLIVVKKI